MRVGAEIYFFESRGPFLVARDETANVMLRVPSPDLFKYTILYTACTYSHWGGWTLFTGEEKGPFPHSTTINAPKHTENS